MHGHPPIAFTSNFEKDPLSAFNSLGYETNTHPMMAKSYNSSIASESPTSQSNDALLDAQQQQQHHNYYHHSVWQPDTAHPSTATSSSRHSSFSLDNPCHQTLTDPQDRFDLSRYLAPSMTTTTTDVVAASAASFLPANSSSSSTSTTHTSSYAHSGVVPTAVDGLHIRVIGVPDKSRVETQARLCIQLLTANGTKVTHWPYLKLPERLLSRSRLKRAALHQHRRSLSPSSSSSSSPSSSSFLLDGNGNGVGGVLLSDESKIVHLDAKVICATKPDQPVKVCSACIQRERKRAERSKNTHHHRHALDGLISEQDRILLVNCGPLVNFSSGDVILPTRIACYCRHHNEKVGFCIQFTMRTHKGDVIATGTSSPILITDDHKSIRQRKRSRSVALATGNENDPEAPSVGSNKSPCILPITPTPSRQGSLSPLPLLADPKLDHYRYALPTPSEERRLSACLPLDQHQHHQPYVDPDHLVHRPATTASASAAPPAPEPKTSMPQLDRLVPAHGPTYGGTEVTVLGSGFYRGLTCLFGEHPATTIYWNPNTLVCVLPPTVQPGPTVVSFKQHSAVLEGGRSQDVPLFTYHDSNDQGLLELALQVVGFKSTGKLQDPKQVAMRIVQQAGDPFLSKP